MLVPQPIQFQSYNQGFGHRRHFNFRDLQSVTRRHEGVDGGRWQHPQQIYKTLIKFMYVYAISGFVNTQGSPAMLRRSQTSLVPKRHY